MCWRAFNPRAVGAEIWLDADWSDGKPELVYATLMTMVTDRPGFASVADASRVWQSATTGASKFYLPLYKDYAGEQIGVVDGEEIRVPSTWRFAGSDLVRTRVISDMRMNERTWTPIARHPSKGVVFVLEQHIQTSNDESFPLFEWRVNYFYDRGVGNPRRHYGRSPSEN